MKPARRWFQYSLRSFLVVVTALAVWLGVVVNRAREQREAVKAIEALGGDVIYEGEDPFADAEPSGPAWLRRVVGNDFFDAVDVVILERKSDIVRSIPHLKRLRSLYAVYVPYNISTTSLAELEAAVPHCKIHRIR
jgi:hypothetical protein